MSGCLYRGFKGDITATNLFPADKRKTTFKADLAQWLISYLVVFLPGSFLVSWLALKLDGNIIDPLSLNTHIPMFGMMGMIFMRDHIPGLRGPGPWRFAIFMIAAVTVMFALSIGTYLLLG